MHRRPPFPAAIWASCQRDASDEIMHPPEPPSNASFFKPMEASRHGKGPAPAQLILCDLLLGRPQHPSQSATQQTEAP